MASVTLLGGCKVLSIEEDRALRARRGADFDADRYTREIWAARVVPTITRKAVPMARLAAAIDADLDRAGAAFGRQAGEGSPWTFPVSGRGVVSSVDRDTRRGIAEIALSGAPQPRIVRIQIGPVVQGTAIRDALPFVAFNDFADQLAFADVGRALTTRALSSVRPAAAQLRPGQTIRFLGVANVREAGEPLVVTPVAIAAGQ